jgi:hypothetical protein
MLAARRIERTGFKCKIVPIPREFSSDCGVCLRTNFSDDRSIDEILSRAGTAISMVFRKEAV